jgi:hypothetical protein
VECGRPGGHRDARYVIGKTGRRAAVCALRLDAAKTLASKTAR